MSAFYRVSEKFRGLGATLPLKSRPLERALLSRAPITPSKGTVRVNFPSTKTRRAIQCESQLEHKAALHMELSRQVSTYCEQPERFNYIHEGIYRTYYPDFKVIMTSGEILYLEIKPLQKLMEDKNYERFKAIVQSFEERGYALRFVTEQEVDHPVRLQNLLLMRAYQRVDLRVDQQKIIELLNIRNELSVSDLLDQQLIPHLSQVYALLAGGVVATDIDRPIYINSMLTLPGGSEHEDLVFTYRNLH